MSGLNAGAQQGKLGPSGARRGEFETAGADLVFAAHGFEPGMRRIRLANFEEPRPMPEADRAAYRRRFLTLFSDESSARRGGLGMVTRVSNALGESFALKTLCDPQRADGESDDAYRARVEASHAAFRMEYESHRAVSGFKGFPRLYGYATVDGTPAIVMEWVDGSTLAQVRRALAVDGEGRLAPLTAARIGRDLFELLTRLSLVGDGFVHRDISPANVMVRTSHLSAAEQEAEGSFDLCLIDFGSSVNLDPQLGESFTARYSTMRCATPGYAPPEMLTCDLPGLAGLRASQKIDVYAAASVVFELVAGEMPFDLAAGRDESPYRIKVDESPRAMVSAHAGAADMAGILAREPEVAIAAGRASIDLSLEPDSDELKQALGLVDSQMAELVAACLDPVQDERPSVEAMRDGLAAFCRNYAQNADRALRGERLIPCTGEASWFDTASPYAVNRLVSAIGGAVSVAVLVAVVCMTAVLLDGVPAVWELGALAWRGRISGLLVAVVLAVPALSGLAARGRVRGTREGFVRGTAALALATAGLLLATSRLSIAGMAGTGDMAAPLAAAAAAGWCPLVLDFAMTVAPGLAAEARRALPGASARGRDLGRGGVMGFDGPRPLELAEADRDGHTGEAGECSPVELAPTERLHRVGVEPGSDDGMDEASRAEACEGRDDEEAKRC